MSNQPLGRLERVDLGTVWKNEAIGFTPWLAREENLQILGDTLGLDLQMEAREKPVGRFRADIICKVIGIDSWMLIENQLGRTDHLHLGQLLTYAAGLQAVTIVWLAAQITDEHRAALDWLNQITHEGPETERLSMSAGGRETECSITSGPSSSCVRKRARTDILRSWTRYRKSRTRSWKSCTSYIVTVWTKKRPWRSRPL